MSQPKLPTVSTKSGLNAISPDTVASLVNGQAEALFSKVLILDCRFNYEYDCGHIQDAIHVQDQVGLEPSSVPSET